MMRFLTLPLLIMTTVAQNIPNTPDRHVTLPDSHVQGKRVMVIGDVHGCYDELMELLMKNDLVNSDHSIQSDVILVFAGDIINKGPKNLQMLKWIQENSDKAYNVYGNHEINIIKKPSKYSWTRDMSEQDWDYVRATPYTISIPYYAVTVVHAGLVPDRSLDEQTEFIMTRMRNIEVTGDGEMKPHEDRRDPGENWAIYVPGPYSVIYGHDAGRGQDSNGNPVIQHHPFATGLDSRCVYGGKLSGVLLSRDPNQNTFSQVSCPEYD